MLAPIEVLQQELLKAASSIGAWVFDFCAELPRTIEDALVKGMAVRAKDRFQTVEDFAAALRENCISHSERAS